MQRKHAGLGGCAVVVLLILAVVASGIWAHATEKTVTITVKRLDDQATSKGHQYLVFTDQGVYKDTDSMWFLKFNSSDLFNELTAGRTYTCRTTGARIPVVSSYRNLLSCSAKKPAS